MIIGQKRKMKLKFNKVLNYILPIENLELIKMINQSNKNYENLKIDEIY